MPLVIKISDTVVILYSSEVCNDPCIVSVNDIRKGEKQTCDNEHIGLWRTQRVMMFFRCTHFAHFCGLVAITCHIYHMTVFWSCDRVTHDFTWPSARSRNMRHFRTFCHALHTHQMTRWTSTIFQTSPCVTWPQVNWKRYIIYNCLHILHSCACGHKNVPLHVHHSKVQFPMN